MAIFFRQFNAIGPLFCSLFNIINLNYGRPKHTLNARNSSKTKTLTSRTSKTLHPPLVFFTCIFFRHHATFFEVFWIPPKGLPFVCFDILQHNGCEKIPKAPFYIFRHCDTVQKSHFFRKFCKISQRSPFNFFIFCNQLEFHKALLQF